MNKGDIVQFLDYEIKNCTNNDGIVLYKRTKKAKGYETHLGNYSTLEDAQKAAIIHFRIARPEDFASTVFFRCMGRGGQYYEYPKFEGVVKREGLTMPEEITCGNGLNLQVYFKDEKITYNK